MMLDINKLIINKLIRPRTKNTDDFIQYDKKIQVKKIMFIDFILNFWNEFVGINI